MGSIHGRLSSVDEASSFFEKVQLHFQLADLLEEFVLLGVGLLTHLLAAVAEDVGQAGQGLFLPAPDLGWVDPEHLRDLGTRDKRKLLDFVENFTLFDERKGETVKQRDDRSVSPHNKSDIRCTKGRARSVVSIR